MRPSRRDVLRSAAVLGAALLGPRSLASAGPASVIERSALRETIARGKAIPRLWSVLLAQDGELLVARRFRGPSLGAPVNVKSVSKSVLSALVGIAIEEGHLEGLDQPIAPFFESYLLPESDPRLVRVTLGDLLSMRSGLQRTSGSSYRDWVSSRDWVGYILEHPMRDEPGERMMYSTGNSHLVSALLTQATGESTHAYAEEHLARPLRFRLPRWRRDPQGIYFGGNQMRMSPRAMLAFGELYRNGGTHRGRQVVPESWVRLSTLPVTRSPFSGELYGYGWFVSQIAGLDAFYAWGYGGQHIFVVPELSVTLVTTAAPNGPRDVDHLVALRAWIAELVEIIAKHS